MSVVLDVRPAAYADAARQVNRVSDGMEVAWMDLLFDLEASVGMAGNDPTGAAWAASYDDVAASAWATTQHVFDAYVHVGRLLQQTGINYARAEAAAAHEHAGHVSVNPLPGNSSGLCTVPTATGATSRHEPPGWHLLAHIIGRLWPNGHQDQLHAAAAAWNQAAREVVSPLAAADQAIIHLAEQRTPESSAAVAVVRGLQAQTHDVATLYRQIAQACTAYAHRLDEAHHVIISEIESFIKWTAGIEIAGAGLALFTLGASEGAAQAVEGAEAARAAASIRSAIDALRALTEAVKASLIAVRVPFAEIAGAMRLILERQLVGIEIVGMDARALGVGTKVEARVASGAVTGSRALSAEEAVISRLEAKQLGTGGSHETWGDRSTLTEHFAEHGGDFGVYTEEDYALEARLFLRRALREKFPIKVDRTEGSIAIYERKTNTFAVYRLNGKTRTIFKPSRRQAYWKSQGGVLING